MNPGRAGVGESLAHRAGGVCLPRGVEVRDGESSMQRDLEKTHSHTNTIRFGVRTLTGSM